MKHITKLMINEFSMTNMDWMGYTLQKGDMFTYHHTEILKKDGGQETRKNGSILCGMSSHPYLHLIQVKNELYYGYLTSILVQINRQGYMPTKNQLLAIDDILRMFEQEHKNDKGSKGKSLIKREYRDRTQKDMRKIII